MAELNLPLRKIEYTLIRKRVKNINLRIKPDMEIVVSASKNVPISRINEFLTEKQQYIIRALDRFEKLKKQNCSSVEFMSGDKILIFGNNINLVVNKSNKNYVNYSVDDKILFLYVKDVSDIQLKRRTIKKWSDKTIKEKIFALCREMYEKFRDFNIDFPEIKFRNMTSRWGSCQYVKGVLTFNLALIKAPVYATEYVVCHEFTHFLVHDHSKKFYQWVAFFMPDWKNRKKFLDNIILAKEKSF